MAILRCAFILLVIPAFHANAQPLVVDASNNPVGIFLEHLDSEFENGWTPTPIRNMHVSTPTGYLFNLETSIVLLLVPGVGPVLIQSAFVTGYWLDDTPNDSNSRHYESPDCSGQAFIPTNTSGIVTSGRIFTFFSSELWYVPQDEPLVLKGFSSRRTWDTEGACEVFDSPRQVLAARAFPNDPGTTGVSSAEFDAPIAITSGLDPGQSSCLFKNGFECAVEN